MTSEVEEMPRLVGAGYGPHGGQWVKVHEKFCLSRWTEVYKYTELLIMI